jgi:hypothetical protein
LLSGASEDYELPASPVEWVPSELTHDPLLQYWKTHRWLCGKDPAVFSYPPLREKEYQAMLELYQRWKRGDKSLALTGTFEALEGGGPARAPVRSVVPSFFSSSLRPVSHPALKQTLFALLKRPQIPTTHLEWLRICHMSLFHASTQKLIDLPVSPWGGIFSALVPLLDDLRPDATSPGAVNDILHHKLNRFARELLHWWTLIVAGPALVPAAPLEASIRRLGEEAERIEHFGAAEMALLRAVVAKAGAATSGAVETYVI